MEESNCILSAFMRFPKIIQQQKGYTLLETLVAMALFLSVLIPLGVTMGNLILDGSTNQMNLALQAAQSEITRLISEHDFTNGTRKDDRGLNIETRVEQSGKLVDLQVTVSSTKVPNKKILILHKSLLVYQ